MTGAWYELLSTTANSTKIRQETAYFTTITGNLANQIARLLVIVVKYSVSCRCLRRR